MQLARLDRYESRLTSMAYMGNFDDLLTTTQPVNSCKKHYSVALEVCLKNVWSVLSLIAQQIDAVLSASLSVFRSARLKKIFEVSHTNLCLLRTYIFLSNRLSWHLGTT